MGLQTLSSRAIIGSFYKRLEQNVGAEWVGRVSAYFLSDQASETYAWIGQSPAMREWIGGRHAKGFRENGLTIVNKHFEGTIDVLKKDVRRDKTGQVEVRINELADRTNSHWASLLSTLIIAGESAACYDSQYFFDTDHAEGDSGTQSNDLSIDISALPTAVHGSTTAPSTEEMQQCILQAVSAILAFKDDQGEPMNEAASDFVVMVPPSLFLTAQAAVANAVLTGNVVNLIPNLGNMRFGVVMNARLASSWTTKFAVFRADAGAKPFIRQEEEAVQMKAKAEGSEYEFDNDAWQFGVDTWRNVGYGYWQHACLVTMA